jgi:hypothetical protein
VKADFRVHVSGGHQVRVVGTVFRIEQDGTSGSVSVSKGAIEFLWKDGSREPVTAGHTLRWPRSPDPAEKAMPPTGVPSATRAPAAGAPSRATGLARIPEPKSEPEAATTSPESSDLESVMDRVLQLKSQRRFGELVTVLRQTLTSPGLGAVQRERLSYELGLALEATGQNACNHWELHVGAYGVGGYRTALESRIERCEAR